MDQINYGGCKGQICSHYTRMEGKKGGREGGRKFKTNTSPETLKRRRAVSRNWPHQISGDKWLRLSESMKLGKDKFTGTDQFALIMCFL